MSVTSQLAKAASPLSRFMAERIPNTRVVLTEANQQLAMESLLESPLGMGRWDYSDADLIADHVLIDIKTTAKPLNRQLLCALIAYLLLDYEDAFGIRALGLYAARRGDLIAWPVTELLPRVAAGSATLRGLRSELRDRLTNVVVP